MKLISKAYQVWVPNMVGHDDPERGYRSIEYVPVIYADNSNLAKQSFRLSDWEDESGKLYTYIDIRVRRAPNSDKYELDGGIIRTKQQLNNENLLKEIKEKRLTKINSYSSDTVFVLQDARDYVGNALSFHAINGAGYVCKYKRSA